MASCWKKSSRSVWPQENGSHAARTVSVSSQKEHCSRKKDIVRSTIAYPPCSESFSPSDNRDVGHDSEKFHNGALLIRHGEERHVLPFLSE